MTLVRIKKYNHSRLKIKLKLLGIRGHLKKLFQHRR